MASEIRHILFQPPEVVVAVSEYFRKVGRSVPRGEVVRCGPVRGGQDSTVRFKITLAGEAKRGRAPEEIRVVVEGTDLAAALILACRALRIPLPAKSDKTLQIFGEQLGLVFTMAPPGPKLEIPANLRL